jgi:hypothetical protein
MPLGNYQTGLGPITPPVNPNQGLDFNPDALTNPLMPPGVSPSTALPPISYSMSPIQPTTTTPGQGGATQATPPKIDFGFGDSIAVQQMRNGRVPNYEGPMSTSQTGPIPFAPNQWAAVGDSPNRILSRFDYLAESGQFGPNNNVFQGKNVFLGMGSNDTSQISKVGDILTRLKAAGAANVVVPGLGPGVPNSAEANKQLQQIVNDAGYTYFQPDLKWAPDGVHPANSRDMYNQATAALANVPTPQTAPGTPQGAPVGAPPNQLAPRTIPPVAAPTTLNQLQTPPGQQPATGPPTDLTQPNVAASPYTGPHQRIYDYAQYYGVPPELALTTGSIESNFDPMANLNKPTQYKGVFQLGNDEWAEMGGTAANRWDPETQINLGVARLAQIRQQLADRLGRSPTNSEVYLAHQQGVAGASAMIENPNTSPYELLTRLGVRPGTAEASITGNIGSKDAFGNPVSPASFVNAPASQFVNYWNDMYNHKLSELGSLPTDAAGRPVLLSDRGAPAVPEYTPPGALQSGDVVPGQTGDGPKYAVGGGAPGVPTVAGIPARAPGEVPQTSMARNLLAPRSPTVQEANTSGAGGPSGSASSDQQSKVNDISQRFLQGQKQRNGWQMLALLGALMKGHTITPMNPELAIAPRPNLRANRMPISLYEASGGRSLGAPTLPMHSWRSPGSD